MSEQIKWSYNPYEQKSKYEVLSQNTWIPSESLMQPQHINGSLNSHIEETIKEINEIYNDKHDLQILFEGTNSDFELLKEFALNEKIACKKGENYYRSADDVLPEIEKNFSEVKQILESFSDADEKTKSEIKKCLDVFNSTIPICLMGVYSAGKSAFINGLIGREILPSKTDPTTAKVYKISNGVEAKIIFSISNKQIVILPITCEIQSQNNNETFITDLESFLTSNRDKSLNYKMYNLLSSINEKEDVSDVIEVIVPFEKSSLPLNDFDFVFYDTPGSDSDSHKEHTEVLKNCLEKQTNGLPIFVTEPNGMDKKALSEIKNMFKDLNLDMSNILIVVSRADEASNKDLSDKKEKRGTLSITKDRSAGVFFVSSIIGIGAKKDDYHQESFNAWVDSSYYEKYESKYRNFTGEKSEELNKCLYKYNFMLESKYEKYCQEAAEVTSIRDKLLYNSGIHCVETAIKEYAELYAKYNKCKNSLVFFEKAARLVTDKIKTIKEKLSEDKADEREKLREDLGEKCTLLRNDFSTEAVNTVNTQSNELLLTEGDIKLEINKEWEACKKDKAHIETFINETIYHGSLTKWHEELTKVSEKYWQDKTEIYKNECVKVITGSEITQEQKEALKDIVLSSVEPNFTVTDLNLGEDFRIVTGIPVLMEHFSLFRWVNGDTYKKVNEALIAKSHEICGNINEQHFQDFKKWENVLLDALDKKMDEFNNELKKLTEKINYLESAQNIIKNRLEQSKQLLQQVKKER